jgi:membrane associated rhomboid family serine protease
MAVCYRHPSRETGVSCSSCGRPICPDCMTPTPVGMRCPECSRDRTKVRTLRTVPSTPVVTRGLILVNAVVFLAALATGAPVGSGLAGTVDIHGLLFGPAMANGHHEYWRIVTSGFLHSGLPHIAINMFSLYMVGNALEPAIGRVNFLVVYLVSLLAGSFGALLFSPDIETIGASGAIFGVFGALIAVSRARGISIWQSGLGGILLLNLVLSVSIPGIAIGAHLGGLAGGLICGWLVVEVGERRRMKELALAGCVLLGVLAVVGAIAVAGGHGIAPNGVGFSGH